MLPDKEPRSFIKKIRWAEHTRSQSHPVSLVIKDHASKMRELHSQCSHLNPEDQPAFISKSYGFFADDLSHTKSYTLNPPDIISIWFQLSGYSPYEKSAIAAMITTAYMMQGLPKKQYRAAPRMYLEKKQLPHEVLEDRAVVAYIHSRLQHVIESQEIIKTRYIHAVREFEAQQGQTENTTTQTQLLQDILDRFGNGIIDLGWKLTSALEEWK